MASGAEPRIPKHQLQQNRGRTHAGAHGGKFRDVSSHPLIIDYG